jgi:hypothetical protein
MKKDNTCDQSVKTTKNSIVGLPNTENCVFAINLSKDFKTEHILIGEFENVQEYLMGADAELLANEKRPFGTLVDEISQLNNHPDIFNAYLNMHQPDKINNNQCDDALKILHKAAYSSNQAEKYIVIRLIQEKNNAQKNNISDIAHIGKIIAWPYLYTNNICENILQWQNNSHEQKDLQFIMPEEYDGEDDCLLQTRTAFSINGKNILAYQITDTSIISLLLWYMYIVFESGGKLQICKQCKKIFYTKKKGEELCSDKCRKSQRKFNKAKFDEKSKADKYEAEYKKVYMTWYNKLKKIRKDPSIAAEVLFDLEQEYREFCEKAKKKKESVKSAHITLEEFNAWISEQQAYAYEKLENTKVGVRTH